MAQPAQGSRNKIDLAPPVNGGASIAVLTCTSCGAVTRVKLGNGSLTCDCGGVRRIVRIAEDAPTEPDGQ